jgi:pilus assembly protein CpaF
MGTSVDLFGSDTTDDINSDVYLIRERVQRKLLNDTDGNLNNTNESQLQQMIETSFNQVIVEENLIYTRNTRAELLNWVVADILGYGPLEPLLQDPTITEVMCNGPDKIYIERRGLIELTKVVFENEDHLMRIIHRIVAPLGRRVDESSPMVDARLPSGYRVNATISPLSLSGPLLTIRKFATTPFIAQDLVAKGTLTPGLVTFLKAPDTRISNIFKSMR